MSNKKKGILGLTPTCVGGLWLKIALRSSLWFEIRPQNPLETEMNWLPEQRSKLSARSDRTFRLFCLLSPPARQFVSVFLRLFMLLSEQQGLWLIMMSPPAKNSALEPQFTQASRGSKGKKERAMLSRDHSREPLKRRSVRTFQLSRRRRSGGFSVKWYWLYLLSLCKLTYDRECRVDLMSI